MQVYNHRNDDPPEDNGMAIVWLFIGAGAIAVADQIIKYLIKIL